MCLEMCREAHGVVRQDWGTLAGPMGGDADDSAVHGPITHREELLQQMTEVAPLKITGYSGLHIGKVWYVN